MEPSPRNTPKLPTHTTTPKTNKDHEKIQTTKQIKTMKKYKQPGKLKPNPGGNQRSSSWRAEAPAKHQRQYSPPVKSFAHLS